MSDHILLVRRLPGLPGRVPNMQFETLEGEVLWTAPMDGQIERLLHGRWQCKVRGRVDQSNQMEILGEATGSGE